MTATKAPLPISFALFLRLILGINLLWLGSGCRTAFLTDPVTGGNYHPGNVYQALNQLPVSVRRVAVLPITSAGTPDLDAGCDLLFPIVQEELGRTHKFELVRVSSQKLRALTGRLAWGAEDNLPANFLKVLREEFDCDAILFTRLTQFRAYPPLAVGLSFKLIEVDHAEYVWANDETFDANDPTVVNGARRFQQSREQLPGSLADSRSILNSPIGFGRYVVSSVITTLPTR